MSDKPSKKCKNCGLTKTVDLFYIYNKKQLHWDMTCASCVAMAARAKRYPEACQNCGGHNRLNSNKNCKMCNKTAGLYECRACHKMLPLEYAFDGRHRQCKWCMKDKRRTRGETVSEA